MRSYFTAVFAVILSLLTLTFTILWINSYRHFFFYDIATTPMAFRVISDHGLLALVAFPFDQWSNVFRTPPNHSIFFLGFGLETRPCPTGTVYRLLLPYWFFVLIFLPYPIYWFRHTEFYLTRTRQRRALGLCPTCAYDLSAHRKYKIAPRCPECGTPIADRP